MFGSLQAGQLTIEFQVLTDDKIASALKVQQSSMRQENVAIGVGLYEEKDAPEAMEIIFREVIKDGCTIVAVEKNTDQVVAVAFNKLHVPLKNGEVNPLEEIVQKYVKPRSALALIEFLDDVESKVNLFEKYDTEAAMEIFYVGTDPQYRGFHIGQGVVTASLALARGLKDQKNADPTIPGVAFGVFTSNFSQRIADALNFEWLETVKYSERNYQGKSMADRIGISEHKTAKLGALRL